MYRECNRNIDYNYISCKEVVIHISPISVI